MCTGADYIDDVDLVRAGGMKALFGGVYAPSTVGTLLREFTFGHARQLDSVLAGHLAGLSRRVNLLPGADARAFIDIDSLLRPVHGHAKQGASYGHTKIAGKQVLRKGLSPLVTTISTDLAAPLVTGIRLRAGKAGSGKGAARMLAQAITTARAAGVTGSLTVRGDSGLTHPPRQARPSQRNSQDTPGNARSIPHAHTQRSRSKSAEHASQRPVGGFRLRSKQKENRSDSEVSWKAM